MINQDLINFIKKQKELGFLKEDITKNLLAAGYTNDYINEGFIFLEEQQALPQKNKGGFLKIIIFLGFLIITLTGLFYFKKDNKLLVTHRSNVVEKNIDSNGNKTEAVRLYTKPSKRPLMGVTGEPLWIIADTEIPATIQYTIAYKNSFVYPGAEQKENIYSKTISVDAGKTIIDSVSADEGVVKIDFKYLDNTGKKVSEIKPAVEHELSLFFIGVLGRIDSDDIFNDVYDLHSWSDGEYSITYTFSYKDKKGKDKSVTKTVLVPMGGSILETSIPASSKPILTYKINF